MNKKTVVVLFGGMSTEHEISLKTAVTIISNLDSEKYYVLPIGITRSGKWLLYNGSTNNIQNGDWETYGTPAIISPDATHKGIIRISGDRAKILPVDVVFPALHGLYGEDGTVQGLFELAKIPYVGCGVLSSAVSMDKAFTKMVVAQSVDIKQANHKVVIDEELNDMQNVIKSINEDIGYPCFIKPANAGSSIGITKAKTDEELEEGLIAASNIDRKIIVEQNISGRELECAVLGNYDADVSEVGEILAANEFYDYDAKYNNAESQTVIPAQISEQVSNKIKEAAVKIFKALDGKGMARVDFFLDNEDEVIFNEINTVPGFTSISMYKKLWDYAGIPTDKLVDKLIELALSEVED